MSSVHPVMQAAIHSVFTSLPSASNDESCAEEGANALHEYPATTDDVHTWRIRMVSRVRKLEQAASDARDVMQVQRFDLTELERETRTAAEAIRQEIAELRRWLEELQGRMAA